jgi:hypothetical protein
MDQLTLTQWSVSKIVELFEEGLIAIPEIQRDLVWTSDQVRELLDSMNKSFPCGALIVWEPRIKDEKLVREIIRPEHLENFENRLPKYFLIDGQQRVSALASTMLEPDFLDTLEPEAESPMGKLFIRVRRYPFEIEAGTDPGSYQPPWFMINQLFLGKVNEADLDASKVAPDTRKKLKDFVQRIRDYQFPVQIIQEQSYPIVGQIFSRVNSQGTQLTGAEIHLASIVPYCQGISKEFRKYRGELRGKWYDLDLTFLMRSITVIACDVPQIKKLADQVRKEKFKKADINRFWTTSKKAINKTLEIIQADLRLDKTKYFVSKNVLVPLVYYVAKETGRLDRKTMMRYFLVSQLGGHYSSASETVMRRDLKYLSEPAQKPVNGLRELLGAVSSEARQEYRSLKIQPRDVSGVASKNVMLLMMYIIMRFRDATDFDPAGARFLGDIPPKEMQLHHIFPYDFMLNDEKALQYKDSHDLSAAEFRLEVNDIANLTFISCAKNVLIRNLLPWQYLDIQTTRTIRKAHFIPEDRNLWKPGAFDKFLGERRRLMADAMNKVLASLGK